VRAIGLPKRQRPYRLDRYDIGVRRHRQRRTYGYRTKTDRRGIAQEAMLVVVGLPARALLLAATACVVAMMTAMRVAVGGMERAERLEPHPHCHGRAEHALHKQCNRGEPYSCTPEISQPCWLPIS
jgi:hypothetical protein